MFALRTDCTPSVHNRLRYALAVPLPPLAATAIELRMESKTPLSSTTGPPAANTAETLRALQERARNALSAQRARMGQLEAQLTDQLDSISEAIADQLSSQFNQQQQAGQSLAEIAALRKELDDVTSALLSEREQAAIDAASRSELLDKQRTELDARADELSSGRRDLESRQQALDDRATQLNSRERELRRTQEELDARLQEFARHQSQLETSEGRLKLERSDLAAKESAFEIAQQSLAARETSLQASQQQLTQDQDELSRRERSWPTERANLETERNSLSDQLANLTNEGFKEDDELASQLADARRELAAQQIAWENEHFQQENERQAQQREHAALVQERESLAAKFATLTDQSQATTTELASQLAVSQQQLEQQQAAWSAERSQLASESLALRHERDELSSALTAAGTQLEAGRGHAEVESERDELLQKFELAIGDIQRLRSRVAELEQELSSRPAADQTDSVELVHLRSERDALAHQVAELNGRATTVVDADTAQQIADLQRRFELAVEDVRDLKKQNAQLESQMAEAKSTAPVAASPAGGDWAAVKKQLLASLEGETGDVAPAGQKEISSIQNTVRITDEVVASKDRQIAELKLKLASNGGTNGDTPVVADGVNANVDSDAVIQKHRARIAQIEQEMEDKLRETEMQLSLERAKIAREQAQLTELRIELESMRGPNGTVSESGGNAPKRRWLSKLGLGDEDKK
jgi:chromosome segregation ATPase